MPWDCYCGRTNADSSEYCSKCDRKRSAEYSIVSEKATNQNFRTNIRSRGISPIAAGRAIAGAAKKAGSALKPTEAGLKTLSWLYNIVEENVKAKTFETLGLVIAAIILVTFGFLWAAIGLIFFVAYLYLPTEAEVMVRAREQAGKKGISGDFNKKIDEVQERLIDIDEEIRIAEISRDAEMQIELIREQKVLLKQLTNISKLADASKDIEESEKKSIRERVDRIIQADKIKRQM